MFYELLVSRHIKIKNGKDLDELFLKYGYETINTLRERASDPSLPIHERKHWRRLLRRAKKSPPRLRKSVNE